jgi:hypothetical protein
MSPTSTAGFCHQRPSDRPDLDYERFIDED